MNMPRPRLRAIEDAFARFGNSKGRDTDRRHQYLSATKALEKLVEVIDRLEEKIKIDRGVQIADDGS